MLLLNRQPIDYFMFSGGEIQVKLPPHIDTEAVILTWKPTNAAEITFLALTVNALKNAGIWDVHNESKTEELFTDTHLCFVTATNIFDRFKVLDDFDLTNLIICSPDDGAYLRVNDLCNYFDLCTPITMCKQRCPDTGLITGMKPNQYNRCIESWNILIIDDICDGGGTFNQAAQILREHGAVNLYLYVTHGIFSKGLDLLQENFKHIYCHHVLHDEIYQSTERLTILRENPIVS